jgi:hypothetical protein
MRRIFLLAVLSVVAPARADEPMDAGAASISVSVTDGGDTTIEVRNGELKVRAGGEDTHVSAGQSLHVGRGQKPMKASLLPAPGKLAPADGDHLNSLDVSLMWAKVDGANRYKLVVASDADFQKPVHESTNAADVKSSVHLRAGTYYWRVVAVDKDGLEGRPSPPQKFVIDTTPPKLKTGKPKWR